MNITNFIEQGYKIKRVVLEKTLTDYVQFKQTDGEGRRFNLEPSQEMYSDTNRSHEVMYWIMDKDYIPIVKCNGTQELFDFIGNMPNPKEELTKEDWEVLLEYKGLTDRDILILNEEYKDVTNKYENDFYCFSSIEEFVGWYYEDRDKVDTLLQILIAESKYNNDDPILTPREFLLEDNCLELEHGKIVYMLE